MQNLLKSNLQKNILKYIILTEQPDYQTISKQVDRDRTTIRQSIESLSKLECIVNEPITPNKKKSKLIFRPTIKGLVMGLGLLDIKLDQIKNDSQKVIDLTLYQQFKNNVGVDKLNEILKICSIGLIDYNLIDNNSKQLFSDAYSINKMFLRILFLSRLLNKDFDIENLLLLYPNETFYKQNVKDVVPSPSLIPLKTVLVKIRDNLQKTINLLSE
jgi:hypothetical protein